MARRVSWTNNSSGHTGTYVYRAPTLDPQNLPAPVATVDPVAQGATAEWVDNSGEYGCFAVQDFDGQGVGTLSTEVCVNDPLSTAQVGDYIEGGVYAGTVTYADNREFHLICSLASGQRPSNNRWGASGVLTAANDAWDGVWNQEKILAEFGGSLYVAFNYCASYENEGNSDWYLPSRAELATIMNRLIPINHAELGGLDTGEYWASTEYSAGNGYILVWVDHSSYVSQGNRYKSSFYTIRPIRRIPV